MPIGTAVHERTFPLCESLNFREWSGYYAVSAYEAHHDHEYNAIRNAAALIDISPLYKYRVSGKDATRLVDRIVTRDCRKVSVGLRHLHAVVRRAREDDRRRHRLAARGERLPLDGRRSEPALVPAERASGSTCRSRTSRTRSPPSRCRARRRAACCSAVADADIENLKYFKVTSGKIAGVPVDISRTGYTGDLGYEVWIPWNDAVRVWDELMGKGKAFDVHAAGMLALDVSRIEAGLLLIDVDFHGAKKALIASQKYSPLEMGLSRLVSLDKGRFVGQNALREEARRGPAREIVGLELEWDADRGGLREAVPRAADPRRGLPRRRAGLRRRGLGREGHVHDVVADAQEDDRARDDPLGTQRDRNPTRDGVHRRGRPAPGAGVRGQDSVLQPAAQDGDAGSMRPSDRRQKGRIS